MRKFPMVTNAFVGGAIALLGLVSIGVAQTQILETSTDSLTAYLSSSATSVQSIRPMSNAQQRGVNLDGTSRSSPFFSWQIFGNTSEHSLGWSRLGDVRLDTGTYSPSDVDIALPAPGFSWVVGRTFNGVQQTSASAHRDSSGYQGTNWHQASQPEIVLFSGAYADQDTIYLIYGADRFLEFRRAGTTATSFKGKNGTAGAIVYVAGTGGLPDTYVYYDQRGTRTWFFGFDTVSGASAGQLWKIVDTAGNTAYVGNSTLSSTSPTTGYTSGRITTAYDSADRRFSYTYTTIDSSVRLTRVTAETKDSSSTWSSPTNVKEVARVDYDFYKSTDSSSVLAYGDTGNLKLVTMTTPMTDSGVNWTREKYYRYWTGSTYNSTNNPGFPNTIKSVVGFEGTRRASPTFNQGYLTLSDTALRPYASVRFEYDTSYRIRSVWFDGQTGGAGGLDGAHTLTYETNASFSATTGYDVDWLYRTIEHAPDGTYVTQFFDEVGQSVSRVITDAPPAGTTTNRWVIQAARDSMGCLTRLYSPAQNLTYVHNPSSGGCFGPDPSGQNLSVVFERVASGDLMGFRTATKIKQGISGTEYYVEWFDYTSRSLQLPNSVSVVRPFRTTDRIFSIDTSTSSTTGTYSDYTTSYDTYHSSTSTDPSYLAPKQVTLSNPLVATTTNGSGSSTSRILFLRADGTIAFTKSEAGVFVYLQNQSGAVSKIVRDANTTSSTDFSTADNPASAFGITTMPATSLRQATDVTRDSQGRVASVTLPTGRVIQHYYSTIADRRELAIVIPRVASGSYFGPATYTVVNASGATEMDGTIAIGSSGTTTALTGWVNESSSDPITAIQVGTIARMQTRVYDTTGKHMHELRRYFSIPTSGQGTSTANYDSTQLSFDDQGRLARIKNPSGTISRWTYNNRGRVWRRYLGTNDASFPSGETSGTDNMVKTEEYTYDGGSTGGNGNVTKVTKYVQDSDTGKREVSFLYDYRGRLIVQQNSVAPHLVFKRDTLGRATAVGEYSDTTGLSITTNPLTIQSNQIGLSETNFDARGEIWKTIIHKISSGADSDNLQSLAWYDAEGRLIKHLGHSYKKYQYDRLGRLTQEYLIGKDNDSAYADASGVSGDTVLQQRDFGYADPSNNIVLKVTIDRFHDDYTYTGALNTNADSDALKVTLSDLHGRPQISANWYDEMDRRIDSIRFGTYGITDSTVTSFDRNGRSADSRSDTALRTTIEYATDGTVQNTLDPQGVEKYIQHDAMGRTVKVIHNYKDGVVGGGTLDDQDQTIAYEYTAGLLTKLTAKMPSGQPDQDTLYTYGVAKGTSAGDSSVACGNFLKSVQYPDSSGGTDVVSYAYDAQGERTWIKDQAGNVTQLTFDLAGRETFREVTTLISGFDGAIRKIGRTYTTRGQVDRVTQYDSSGSVVDEVQLAHDDWGDITELKQDMNSVVASSGGDHYTVGYSYAKSAPANGRNLIRRSGMTLPDGTSVTYGYSSSTSIENIFSRVANVSVGSTSVASYAYLGAGKIVQDALDQAKVTNAYFLTGNVEKYGCLDRFNRPISSRWTSATDFYRVDFSRNRLGSPFAAQDFLHRDSADKRRFDVNYLLDDLQRVRTADEGQVDTSTSPPTVSNRQREEEWTLGHTGSWTRHKLDLNGDLAYSGSGEMDDSSTFNSANEITTRDTDSNTSTTSNNYTISHDAVGNLTDDGVKYTYTYDVFGRLRFIKKRSNGAVVEEFLYNGLGYRRGWHYDANVSGTVDSSDPWYYFVYDLDWRQVATYRGSDAKPKEQFVYHNAGSRGLGHSMPRDAVVLRDRDANTAWTSASDTVLEERCFYCQNWRGDVSAVLDSSGQVIEWVKYSAFGVPICIPLGDYDCNGSITSADSTAFFTDFNLGNIRADLNFDGVVDIKDKTVFNASYNSAQGGGRGVLSRSGTANRIGYAGYQYDSIASVYHVRNRVYLPELGRWSRRDPFGYIDGMSMYQYCSSSCMSRIDPLGLGPIDWIADHVITPLYGVDHLSRMSDAEMYGTAIGVGIVGGVVIGGTAIVAGQIAFGAATGTALEGTAMGTAAAEGAAATGAGAGAGTAIGIAEGEGARETVAIIGQNMSRVQDAARAISETSPNVDPIIFENDAAQDLAIDSLKNPDGGLNDVTWQKQWDFNRAWLDYVRDHNIDIIDIGPNPAADPDVWSFYDEEIEYLEDYPNRYSIPDDMPFDEIPDWYTDPDTVPVEPNDFWDFLPDWWPDWLVWTRAITGGNGGAVVSAP